MMLHNSEEDEAGEIHKQQGKDRGNWIWEDDSDVLLLGTHIMLFGNGPREGLSSKVQNLLNLVRQNDNLSSREKKKVRDLILNCADILTTQPQDLEACALEQFQINVIQGFPIPTATSYRTSISDDEFME